ncbi:MAG: PRC-barrel domain-containing protein [Solirubrobacterales bacterium]
MYKSKDFSLMEVIHIKNNRIGFIKDLLIDFNGKRIMGFEISCYDFFNKKLNVMKEDIISFDNSMVIKNTCQSKYLSFKNIRGIDIWDINGNMLGMLEDIIFEERNFKIYGVILCSGLLNNYFKGKEILLAEELILGDNSMLCFGSRKICFSSKPHNIQLSTGGEAN